MREGEEVTISYGSWPNDVFLLFFGYVDAGNPNDAVCLFTDLLDLTTFNQRLVPAAEADTACCALEAELGAGREEFYRCALCPAAPLSLHQSAEASPSVVAALSFKHLTCTAAFLFNPTSKTSGWW